MGAVGGGVHGGNLLRGKGNSLQNPSNRILTEGRPGSSHISRETVEAKETDQMLRGIREPRARDCG